MENQRAVAVASRKGHAGRVKPTRPMSEYLNPMENQRAVAVASRKGHAGRVKPTRPMSGMLNTSTDHEDEIKGGHDRGTTDVDGSVQAGSVQAGSVQAGSVQAGSVQELKQLSPDKLGRRTDDLNRSRGEEETKTLDRLNELFLKGDDQLKNIDKVHVDLLAITQRTNIVQENQIKIFNNVKGLLTNQENMIKSMAERQAKLEKLLTEASDFQSAGNDVVKRTSETVIQRLGNTETIMKNMAKTLNDMSEQQNESGQSVIQTVGFCKAFFQMLVFMMNSQMEITKKEQSVLSALEGLQTSQDMGVKEMTALQQNQQVSMTALGEVLMEGRTMLELAGGEITETTSSLQLQVDGFATQSQTLLSIIDNTLTQQKDIVSECASLHTTENTHFEEIKTYNEKLKGMKDTERKYLQNIHTMNDQATQGLSDMKNLLADWITLYHAEKENLNILNTIQTSSVEAVSNLQRVESASTENLKLGHDLRQRETTAIQNLSAMQTYEMDLINKVTDEKRVKETFSRKQLGDMMTRLGVILREVDGCKSNVSQLGKELSQLVINADGNIVQIREMFGKFNWTTVLESLSILTEGQTELHQSLSIRDKRHIDTAEQGKDSVMATLSGIVGLLDESREILPHT